FKEPRGVRPMPLRGARIRHRLDTLILVAQRRREMFRVSTNDRVALRRRQIASGMRSGSQIVHRILPPLNGDRHKQFEPPPFVVILVGVSSARPECDSTDRPPGPSAIMAAFMLARKPGRANPTP